MLLRARPLLRVNSDAEVGDRERRGTGECLGSGLNGLQDLYNKINVFNSLFNVLHE